MTLSSWFFILWISGFSASSLKQICCFVPQSFSVNFFNLIFNPSSSTGARICPQTGEIEFRTFTREKGG